MEKIKTHFILIAGLSADHLEAVPLQKSLKKNGFSVDVLSFYGEGYIDDFTDLKIADCIANISEFINKRARQYDNVYAIGISLGGALLLEHAKKCNNLQGIASMSTPFKLNNKVWINFGQKFLPLIYIFWKPLQKVKFLRLNPLGATDTVMEYLDGDLHKNLNLVQTPVLFLHSKKDPVSNYKIIPEYLNLISSKKKKIKYFNGKKHVVHHDHDPDLVIRCILDFFELSH